MPISIELSHSWLASLSLASQTSGSSELVEVWSLDDNDDDNDDDEHGNISDYSSGDIHGETLAKPAEAVRLLKSQLMTIMRVAMAMVMTINLMMTLMMTTTLTTRMVTMMMGKTLARPAEAVHSRWSASCRSNTEFFVSYFISCCSRFSLKNLFCLIFWRPGF